MAHPKTEYLPSPLEYLMSSLVSTPLTQHQRRNGVDAGVDTEQLWRFLNIVILPM